MFCDLIHIPRHVAEITEDLQYLGGVIYDLVLDRWDLGN